MNANLASETLPSGKLPAEPPPSIEELAPHFPQLELLECLGRGGMGVVYKARQPKLNRLVALKILAPERERDPAFAKRFTHEAQALAKLSHPSIVAVHDFGVADGLYYLLMEYVDGVSLGQLLHSGRLGPREALAIVPQICDALQYAHDHGIVHRDIKPENILLDRQGRVKVADFGLAKLISQSGTGVSPVEPERQNLGRDAQATAVSQASLVMGTPAYMAPEQRDHPSEVDHRADIYSLGVVFYQMLTGELPKDDFAPPSKKVVIDVRLDEVVLRALEKEPALRYQQASVLKTQVETIFATPPPSGTGMPPVSPGAASPGGTLRSPPQKNPWRPAVLTVGLRSVLLLVAVGGLVVLVPKFADTFKELGVQLPLVTRLTAFGSAADHRAGRTADSRSGKLAVLPAPWPDGEAFTLAIKTPAGMEIGTLAYQAKLLEGDSGGKPLWEIVGDLNVSLNGLTQHTRVVADKDTFAPSAGLTRNNLLGEFVAAYEPGKVRLTATGVTGRANTREIPLLKTAYDNEQVLFLIRRLPLAIGYQAAFPIFPVQGGAVVECRIEVQGKETKRVEAGEIVCFKVKLDIWSQQTCALQHVIYYSCDALRRVVYYDSGATYMELMKASAPRKESQTERKSHGLPALPDPARITHTNGNEKE
jgi:tRNA A-37 threonylcarbamoyl transferase component Bud32